MKEFRYCDRCCIRTEHEILNIEEASYNPRGRTTYRCKTCGRTRRMRRLRPSSEVSY